MRKKKDTGKGLHPSKVRAVIICSECGRPRLIFTKHQKDASVSCLHQLDAYCEQAIFTYGDALFCDDAEGTDAKLAKIFYNRESLSCRDLMEIDYFNYGGLRGRSEFEHVCARCGKSTEESVLVEKEQFSAHQLGGRIALPLCTGCFEAGEDPVTAKRSDKVTEELERKVQKNAQKEAIVKEQKAQPKSTKGAKASVLKAEEPKAQGD